MRQWLAILFVVVGCTGCTVTIVPPRATARVDVLPVMVADYGYHSTIILPKSDGGLVEYAYGDWTYFGNNNKTFLTTLGALFASDQATLGRRVLNRTPWQSGLEEDTGAHSIVRFSAPRDKVEELERELDQRFSTRLDSIMYSPVHHLYFVKDNEHYSARHNCNHFTAEWLERLGCKVQGIVVGSSFRVRDPEHDPSSQPTAGRSTTARSTTARSTTGPTSKAWAEHVDRALKNGV